MPVKNGQLFQIIEQLSPLYMAEDWDNVGLQIGAFASETERVLLTLDVDENVVQEAVENNVNLIVAHHPLWLKGIKNINIDTPQGRLISRLIKNDITVYAAHTNLDSADGGVNTALAQKLALQDVAVLCTSSYQKHVKETAYGLGRIGTLPQPLPLEQFINFIKEKLDLKIVKAGGSFNKEVKIIAVCGGSGSELWLEAAKKGADVYVTGDVKYHVAQNMLAGGLAFVDVGHFASEFPVIQTIYEYLSSVCREKNMQVEIMISKSNKDPFSYF
ncbi:MAG: Nif3-like dinuclear metal center hexameric protein [Desulfotomaculum sp.]|nr:Nif3-like dinuclear metal center hexameric protein [Desulfotomaculum sp.]